jgi:hypothetical protein
MPTTPAPGTSGCVEEDDGPSIEEVD